MKVVGLITEYNPFHKGHQYHIEKAKELTGADHCIAVMSGDYVQRGTPAVFDKYLRTQMALSGGVDAVLELPLVYACGSAEFFASGAISILNKLGCVDYLCFGSEAGDMKLFGPVSQILSQESPLYKETLQASLRQGLTFPAARANALQECFHANNTDLPMDELRLFLSSPNNILGLEYCKAILQQKASLLPVTIARQGQGYHSMKTEDHFSSASAIRSLIENHTTQKANLSMPLSAYELIVNHMGINGPVTADDFSLLLKYRLMNESADTLTDYWDMTEELASRIYNNLNAFTSFTEFAQLLKTKEITFTRIQRALLHVLLGIKTDTVSKKAEYTRLLGFKKDSSILKCIKNNASIPVITKASDASKILSGTTLSIWEQDIKASNLYESVSAHKFKRSFKHEYQQQLLIK